VTSMHLLHGRARSSALALDQRAAFPPSAFGGNFVTIN
jgi:hypothetical protein